MGWFSKKPTEDELERSVLFAAMLARAKERDTNHLTSNDEIQQFLDHAFNDIGVKPNRKDNGISALGVQTLLAESNFINEALDYRIENGGEPMPESFRARMLKVMQQSLSDFRNSTGRS